MAPAVFKTAVSRSTRLRSVRFAPSPPEPHSEGVGPKFPSALAVCQAVFRQSERFSPVPRPEVDNGKMRFLEWLPRLSLAWTGDRSCLLWVVLPSVNRWPIEGTSSAGLVVSTPPFTRRPLARRARGGLQRTHQGSEKFVQAADHFGQVRGLFRDCRLPEERFPLPGLAWVICERWRQRSDGSDGQLSAAGGEGRANGG